MMYKISLQFCFLLTTLFLFSFSCEDHTLPEVPAVIETLELFPTENAQSDFGVIFKLEFKDLGNIPVTEYGIVYSTTKTNSPLDVLNLTGDDKLEKFTAPMPPVLGQSEQSKFPLDFLFIYYRAYAKLSNGTVVYGKTLSLITS